MLKFFALPLLFAAVNAGLLGAPLAYHAPAVVAAPIAVKTAVPVASSYQNTYQISTGAVAVAAPVIKAVAAPVAAAPYYSAPVVHSVAAAPLVHSVAAAPLIHSVAAAPVIKAW